MNKAELLARLNAKKETAPTTPTPQDNKPQAIGKKSKLVSLKIMWSEATDEYDNHICKTWKEANDIFVRLAKKDLPKIGEGYCKTKICITWENGYSITDRVDMSATPHDFNPFKKTIQEFLQPANGVMYDSSLNKGDRDTLLSWEDDTTEPTEPKTPTNHIEEIPAIFKQLLGIVEVIEESQDTSEKAALKAAEQVEKCNAYIAYLQAMHPLLKAKADATINANKLKNEILTQLN